MKIHLIGLAALLLAAGGCAHSRSPASVAADNAWQVMPPVLSALTGPGAVLLTNLAGWQGQVVFTLAAADGHTRQVTGWLAVSQGRLNFESAAAGKNLSGRFGIIWDTAANTGWLMSEALQGAAPVSATNRYTVSQREPNASGTETRAGHPVQNALVTLQVSDGKTVQYQVAQATDLALLALQAVPLTGPAPVTFSVSNLKLTPAAESEFTPPDDYTKYTDAVALLDELISRQRTVYSDKDDYHPPAGLMEPPGAQSHFQNNPVYQH